MSDSKQWDIFICHASEDKGKVAYPLSDHLKRLGYSVWYDEVELALGDSLREKIDEGLANSRFGVVILSPKFFSKKKKWTKKELGGLFSREISGENKVILPVLHNLTHVELAAYSPMLADIVAARMDEGIDVVAKKIREVLDAGEIQEEPQQTQDIRQNNLIIARTDRIYEISGAEVVFDMLLADDGQHDKLSNPFEYNGHILKMVSADSLAMTQMPPPMGHRGPVLKGVRCQVLGTVQ